MAAKLTLSQSHYKGNMNKSYALMEKTETLIRDSYSNGINPLPFLRKVYTEFSFTYQEMKEADAYEGIYHNPNRSFFASICIEDKHCDFEVVISEK